MEFEFFMAMIPPTITAQEHKIVIRNGKPFYYDPPELMAARQNASTQKTPGSMGLLRPRSRTQTISTSS